MMAVYMDAVYTFRGLGVLVHSEVLES
jgi:hypothetical protein